MRLRLLRRRRRLARAARLHAARQRLCFAPMHLTGVLGRVERALFDLRLAEHRTDYFARQHNRRWRAVRERVE